MKLVTDIKGVGKETAKLLHRLGLTTANDVIENIPRRYDDYSKITPLKEIRPGSVTIRARIHSVKKRYSKRGLHITEALVSDNSGSIRVMWFNQPYRAQSLKPDQEYYLSGEFAQNYRFFVLSNPTCELVSNFPLHTARLVPQYRLTKGLGAHTLRKITKAAFDDTEASETLPEWLVKNKELMPRHDALLQMHFPDTPEAIAAARRRLGFEELFQMTLASELNKRYFAAQKARTVAINEPLVVTFVNSLPFKLTDDQRKASWQILQDMTSGSPMNRLLQGDVGSGKTAVASIAMVNVASSGLQSVFMAPTELLASQHADTISSLLPAELRTSVVFLSGSMSASQKQRARGAIAQGKALIIIGTHAVFQSDVHFKDLALVIIDEQHRFGVEQRKALQGKASVMPHVLNMTATPIPRSIALTLYGEMDVSILAQKPANRQPVATKLVIPESRERLYVSIHAELQSGRQAFVVCPQIIADEKPGRALSVEAIQKQIQSWLKGVNVAILHGKMRPDEKEAVMRQFVENTIQVLVATTVIEVGVDVPNASVMVIEGADKFGLAQLHQLRGRIGRGVHAGFCYLVPTDNDTVPTRLKVIASEHDGFKLADYDLELRGPGAIYGTVQHGALDLRVAKITDTKLIAEAREAAREFIVRKENLIQYPQLKTKVDRLRTITNLN